MRRRYRWNPKINELEEVFDEQAPRSHHIAPTFQEFVSPVDGKPIHGRKALRDHNRRHGVTNVDDYKEEWAKKAQERHDFLSGKTTGREDRADRVEAIKHALEVHKKSEFKGLSEYIEHQRRR